MKKILSLLLIIIIASFCSAYLSGCGDIPPPAVFTDEEETPGADEIYINK